MVGVYIFLCPLHVQNPKYILATTILHIYTVSLKCVRGFLFLPRCHSAYTIMKKKHFSTKRNIHKITFSPCVSFYHLAAIFIKEFYLTKKIPLLYGCVVWYFEQAIKFNIFNVIFFKIYYLH